MYFFIQQVSQIAEQLPRFFQIEFNLVATTTLIIWNIFSTLDEEVRFIWSSNLTFAKGLYFVVRYLALLLFCGATLSFFGHLGADPCTEFIKFLVINGITITACSKILLVQRVYAFYGCSKCILWIFYSGFVLSESLVIVVTILELQDFRAEKDILPSPIPELFGYCFKEFPSISSFGWFCEIAFEAVAFVCIVTRFVKLSTEWRTGFSSNSGLYKVFLRDGTWTFLILFLFYLFSAILLRAQNIPEALSISLWAYALSSICCTRLILNLHHAAKGTQYSNVLSWDGGFHQELSSLIVVT